jgi:hypothetical protein
MKKYILLLVAVLGMANYSIAQNDRDPRERLRVGIKAGLNYSNIYDSDDSEMQAEGKIGAVAGMFAAIPIGKYMGIQPEIQFAQKGFKATGNILGSSYTFTRTTNFIDVPLLFQLKPIKYVTVVFGPQYSYMFKQTDKFSNTSFTIEQDFNNDNIRKNLLCLLAGLDFNIGHFVVGTRVGIDLQKNNGDNTSTTPRYKNVWAQLTVGGQF